MNLKSGDRIGDYEILGVLGAGGMGSVYKVRNVISDRVEALKVLLPNLAEHQDLKDRFLREIKTSASLEHTNIAGLRTAFQSGDMLLMVMEFVEGETLDARLKNGPLPVDEAVRYTAQVLDALEYAHSRGVVHRDIKPANVMITPRGTAKLLDFGIARASNDKQLTMTGTTLGSLYYMSPEQIRGEHVDARADLYSLGITLYEIVTGKRPFGGDSGYAIMAEHLQKQPVPPVELDSRVPQSLNTVILRSLAKSAGDRFQDAAEFRSALRNVAFGPSGTRPSMDEMTAPRPAAQPAQMPPMPVPAVSAAPKQPTPPAFSTPPAPAFSAQPVQPMPSAGPSPIASPYAEPTAPKKSRNTLALALIAVVMFLMVGAVALVFASSYFFSGDTTTAAGVKPGFLDRIAGIFASGKAGEKTEPEATDGTTPGTTEGATTPDALSASQTTEPISIDGIERDKSSSLAASTAGGNVANAGVAGSVAGDSGSRPIGGLGSGGRAATGVGARAAALATQGIANPSYAQKSSTGEASGGGSSSNTAASQDPYGSAKPSAPKVDPQELEESRDFFAKLGIRAGTIQESARKLSQEQSAMGVSLRADIRASIKRMEYLMDRSEAALNNGDLEAAKTQMQYAEREIEKLEKFFHI